MCSHCYYTTSSSWRRQSPLERLLAREVAALAPSPLTEEAWRRRDHADLGDLSEDELTYQLFVLRLYLSTRAGQRDWLAPWFAERVAAIERELARRNGGVS
jgi:hypothetical protein